MDSVCLPFGHLPGQNPLFVDFAHQFAKVRDFYNPPPVSESDIEQRLERARHSCQMPRGPFSTALTAYGKTLYPSRPLDRHLEAFQSEDCVAVVTGQNVGLFGGPSFTVFKAATAIRLAGRLREQGVNAVPVFWLASNDSDFEEIRVSHFVDSGNDLLSISFPDTPEDLGRMAGTVELNGIGDCLDQLQSGVASYPFADSVLGGLSQDYHPSRSFREAFAAWISRLFSDYGLIVFDPLMDGYQNHLSRFYEIAVTQREPLVEALLERNRQINEAGYEPQVWIDPNESLLFLVDGSRRYKLVWRNGRYETKERPGLSFSREELLQLARREPHRLGVNVLLRPILQDYLFPTAFYIGGPSEVAYFAQLNAIADQWDLEPIILPRAGFTIVNHRDQKYLRRHRIEPLDVLQKSTDDLTEIILRETRQGQTLEQIESVTEQLRGRLLELQELIHASDPTVAEMLDNTRDKMLYQLEKVKTRFITNHRRTAPSLKRHVDHLLTHLRPMNKPQERVLNFNHFLMDMGPGFLNEITDLIDPFCFSHRLLRL